MTLKRSLLLALIIFLCFFKCGKAELPVESNDVNDTIQYLINNASDLNGSHKKRLMYNKDAEKLILKQINDSLNSEQIIELAHNFYLLREWTNLKQLSKIFLLRSIDKNDDYFIGQSYRWLGIYYENMSMNDSAFHYYLKAEKKFKKRSCKEMLCWIYRDQSLVKYFSNDFLGSDEHLVKALKIAKELNLLKQQVYIYMSLGSNASALKDYEHANKMQNMALMILKSNNFLKEQSSICYNHIGVNYYNTGEYRKSIIYFEKSLSQLVDIPGQEIMYCKSLDDFNRSKIKLTDFKEVEETLIKTSKIRDSLNINQGKNHNKLFLSEYYQATNQHLKAKKFAIEAYQLSKSFRNAGDILVCLKQLMDVDSANTLKYSQEYIRISDSIQVLERQTRNKFAKIAYETEELTNEKDQAIYQKRLFLGIAILVFIIGGLLVLLLIQRSKQKELQFLQEQQRTNEEIYQLIQNQQTQIDEARRIEKKRIAQDLHDGVMNRLSSTRLNLHILTEKATPEIIRKCLPFIGGIQDIEKEIRNISHDLNRDALFNKVSFVAVVEAFIEEQKSTFNGNCHLEIDKSINWDLLSSFQKINMFRIMQEAFQNTIKHAYAKNIIISFLRGKDNILLEIFDDGVGFSLKQKKKGIGLQNIFSRAKQCNGIAEVQTDKLAGTTIRVTIPIESQL